MASKLRNDQLHGQEVATVLEENASMLPQPRWARRSALDHLVDEDDLLAFDDWETGVIHWGINE